MALFQQLAEFYDWSTERIKSHLQNSFVPKIAPMAIVQIPDYIKELVVIEGYFQDYESKRLYIAPALIPRECGGKLFSVRFFCFN